MILCIESANDEPPLLSGARYRFVGSLEIAQLELRSIADCVGTYRVPHLECNGFRGSL